MAKREPTQPLPYRSAEADQEIVIDRFADGGVRIVLPARQPVKLRWTVAILPTLVASTVFVIAVSKGYQEVARACDRAIAYAQAYPATLLVVVVPLAVWVLSIALRMRRIFPTVLGISSQKIHVDHSGLFGRTRFTLPRTCLRRVQLVRWKDLWDTPRYVEIVVDMRWSVVVGANLSREQLVRIFRVLEEATKATAPA